MENQEQINPSLSEKILERIERENICPESKLKLRMKNDSFWVLWVFSIIIGAFAVAGSLFVLLHSNWQFYNATYDTFFDFIFDTLPYLWILTLLIFLLLAHQNIRHTKYGYRYPLIPILLLSIFASIICGACLYIIGLGQIVEEGLGGYIPLYKPTSIREQSVWNNPERGLIAGDVLSYTKDYSSIMIGGFDGKKWMVDGKDLISIDQIVLSKNPRVRVVGILEGTSTEIGLFHGCMVLPWSESIDSNLSERKIESERINICKGVRPYELLEGQL